MLKTCAANAPITQLRELRDSENADGFDKATWNSMNELGWAAIPGVKNTGSGIRLQGLGVVTEESGRTLTANPLFASVWVGGTLLNLGGSDAQSQSCCQCRFRQLKLALALESHRQSLQYRNHSGSFR